MKVIIAGSRSITDYQTVEMAILSCPFSSQITEVVSGKASGIDTLGEVWAKKNNIPVKPFPANWNYHGKAAGPIRNQEMADYSDALIAIQKDKSKGTQDMINRANRKGLQIHIVEVE